MKTEQDHEAEAAALNATPPVRFMGVQFEHPLFQQDPPGVGSFVLRHDETSVAQAFERARRRYMREGK
jgi:hypothetical protein